MALISFLTEYVASIYLQGLNSIAGMGLNCLYIIPAFPLMYDFSWSVSSCKTQIQLMILGLMQALIEGVYPKKLSHLLHISSSVTRQLLLHS